MKLQYLNVLCAGLVAFTLASCSVDEGTMAGNDSLPKITIYHYAPSLPNNPDNDLQLRFAANEQTTAGYYLVEPTEDRDTHIAQLGEAGYADYIVDNGTQLEGISGASLDDVLITNLMGPYTITAVAVGGSAKVSSSIDFLGLQWETVAEGTYYFNEDNVFKGMDKDVELQFCTTEPTLYRFKDLFSTGYHLKINLLPDYTDIDEDGDEYTFFRIPSQSTPYKYGDYGTISVRDIGYMTGDDSYVTEKGYESGMYEDGFCFLCIQCFVSAGSLGYGYDYFVPNE